MPECCDILIWLSWDTYEVNGTLLKSYKILSRICVKFYKANTITWYFWHLRDSSKSYTHTHTYIQQDAYISNFEKTQLLYLSYYKVQVTEVTCGKKRMTNSAPASLWITALLTWWQNKGIFEMHCKVFLISAKCICCHPMIPGQETAPLMLIPL